MSEFRFYTRLNLVRILGYRSRNVTQLYEGIRDVPAASIYYHTHRFLQQHSYLSPEPPNDFAYWVTNTLKIKNLGESLASIDTIRFTKIEELRREFLRILGEWLQKNSPSAISSGEGTFVTPGEEFNFMSCVTFIMPTGYIANDESSFIDSILKVTVDSIYFHMFEARLRLGKDENDFSLWFRDMGKNRLADELSRLDPYNITLEGLRKKIISLVKNYDQDR